LSEVEGPVPAPAEPAPPPAVPASDPEPVVVAPESEPTELVTLAEPEPRADAHPTPPPYSTDTVPQARRSMPAEGEVTPVPPPWQTKLGGLFAALKKRLKPPTDSSS
ncbi:MAG: hypothetical protein AAB576_07400, partial [Elusimicrobiota bacterium]